MATIGCPTTWVVYGEHPATASEVVALGLRMPLGPATQTCMASGCETRLILRPLKSFLA